MIFKASVAAMAAVTILAIALPPSSSMGQARCGVRAGPPCPTTSSSTPGGSNPGGGPDLPLPPPAVQVANTEQVCNGALHTLAKIPVRFVVAFSNEQGVAVVPLCNSGIGHSVRIDNSQALPLQHAIAGNTVLMSVLTAHGFHAEDVVGVSMGQDVATLYVHRGM